jgi:hypothetical protein
MASPCDRSLEERFVSWLFDEGDPVQVPAPDPDVEEVRRSLVEHLRAEGKLPPCAE